MVNRVDLVMIRTLKLTRLRPGVVAIIGMIVLASAITSICHMITIHLIIMVSVGINHKGNWW